MTISVLTFFQYGSDGTLLAAFDSKEAAISGDNAVWPKIYKPSLV